MWGYQHIFRTNVQSLVTESLQRVGAQAASPSVYLIGFREGEDPEHLPICVEPEYGSYGPSDLGNVLASAQNLFANHPERAFRDSDPGLHRRRKAALLDRCVGDALTSALNKSAAGRESRFFVGASAFVENYRVFPVIEVDLSRWSALPALMHQHVEQRIRAHQSLHAATISEVLDAATKAMNVREPPVWLSIDPDDIVRKASDEFIERLVLVHGNWGGPNLRRSIDAVAAQPYEGRSGTGSLLFGSPDSYESILSFQTPIALNNTRAFRKALEMTAPGLSLISDGQFATGLGRPSPEFDFSSERAFSITVVGRGSWEFAVGSTRLARFDNTFATLPSERISEAKFLDTVGRLFPSRLDSGELWRLARKSADQAHGTMLVVHEDVEAEVRRLGAQAIAVTPQSVNDDLLIAITSIDGAVLLDPEGRCHAIGVILDGLAVEGVGDPARGARFNSGSRYVRGASGGCLAIIVSEDGMIDLVPDLMRRVNRSSVEDALSKMEAASCGEITFDVYFRLEKHVRALAFYLSPGQCERANLARENVESFRSRSGSAIMRVGYESFTPNPQMNDSYFL